jgi:peptidoglycan hydrolase CwlO-like protein
MIKRTKWYGVMCASLLMVQVQAQESGATPPPMSPATKELNDMLALRAKLMIEAHKTESEIHKAANDPAITSPEIEKLRKKIEDLQNEIIRTYGAIREEIEKRPEIKEKRKQIAEKEKQIEELNKKLNPISDGKK